MKSNFEDLEYFNHDIDWFCIGNDISIHAASNGCKFPSFGSPNRSKQAYDLALQMPILFDEDSIKLNSLLKEQLKNDYPIQYIQMVVNVLFPEIQNPTFDFYFEKIYCRDFVEMAKRGFVSYDGVFDDKYRIIAWPPEIKKIENPDFHSNRNLCKRKLFDNQDNPFGLLKTKKLLEYCD